MSMKPTLSSQNSKPKTPKSPVSPTVRQLLQAERLSNYLSNNNINNNVVSPKLGKDSQQDDDRFNFNFQPTKKLSVLAKVKEKARKWKQSIGKKKPGQDTDPSSSWGAAYEDYDKDETPRRLGTTPSKLYGLRRSSSSYKEGGLSRQRSLSGLSISEKHVLSCSVDRGYNEQCERIPQKESSHSPIQRLPSLRDDVKRLKPIKTKPNEPKIEEYHDDPVEDVEKDKPPPSYEEVMHESKEKHITPQKSNIEEAKVEPLASIKSIERIQEAITIEEAKELNQICLKIIHREKGKRPTPSPEEGAFQDEKKQEIVSPTKGKSLAEAVTEKLTPTSTSNSEEQGFELLKPLRVNTTRKEAPVCVVDESDDEDLEENGIAGECKWDKGVSVKEYIKNKLEPGEDERALSQVISEAISPRRTPGDKGVMEKVKEAVTLLLLAEQRHVKCQEEKHKQDHHHHHQQQQQHYQQQQQHQHYQQQQLQHQHYQQQQQQQYQQQQLQHQHYQQQQQQHQQYQQQQLQHQHYQQQQQHQQYQQQQLHHQHYQQQQQQHQHYQQQQRSSSQPMRHSSSSLQIPVSTNAYEDELNVEEESDGRILQAN